MPVSAVTVAIVLAQRFPLLSLAACLESLRVADREHGQACFIRRILTPDDAPVSSSSGVPIAPDMALADMPFAPVIIVLSSYKPEEACKPALLAWLRKHYRQGAVIGCVDTASYILAKARILGAHKVSVHRESISAYRELLADSVLLDQLFSSDDRIVSSAGGIATMDMMLGLIKRFHGNPLADRVAHVLNYRPLAADAKSAETSPDGMIARVERRLARLIELMQANIEQPADVAALCTMAEIPPATANRLFQRHFRMSPSRYYTRLRLERAHWLLGNSPLPVAEIAAKVGFAGASAFTRAYRRQFGKTPAKIRQAG